MQKLTADDHQESVGRLRKSLTDKKVNDLTGVQRFKDLIGKKHAVAYGKGRISENDMKLIVDSSQRFSSWINQMGKKLNVEGWGDVATEA